MARDLKSIEEMIVVHAEDDQPMKMHLVCTVCFPHGAPMGSPAVCGDQVLGEKPCPEDKLCTRCDSIWFMMRRFGCSFPLCGHGGRENDQ